MPVELEREVPHNRYPREHLERSRFALEALSAGLCISGCRGSREYRGEFDDFPSTESH